jgi:3-hydroxypropanoate dehydrogenase
MTPAFDRDRISETALNQLFHEAHTTSVWLPRPVSDTLLHEIYDVARLGPTSANTQPARFVFITTDEAKARLLPAMSAGNQDKTRTAPVTVLVAWDTEFYEHLPRVFPQANFRPIFAGNAAVAEETAFRNS